MAGYSRMLIQSRGRNTYRHILGLEFFDSPDLAFNVSFLDATGDFWLLRLTSCYLLVPDPMVGIINALLLC